MPEVNFNDHQQKLAVREKEAKTVRRIVFITTLVIVLIVAGVAAGGHFYISNALSPVDPDSEKQVEVKIELGSSVSDIANKLEEKGIIHNATVFRYYIKYKNENGFQAGLYQFSPSSTIDQIIEKLKEGKVYKKAALTLTIPEGLWMIDIADIIANHTDLNKKDILKKMKDREYIKKTYLNNYPFLNKVILKDEIKYPLEGYLFPATYSFEKKDPSLEVIINKMLGKMSDVLNKVQVQQKKGEMSIHEVLTLSSLIEEEATEKASRRKISSVFYNRMKSNMILQFDPTVKYALQSHDRLSDKDLEVKSPYNTYTTKGLPPGPISNPGISSIKAAVNPAKTEFKYFFARVNGEIIFSETYQQHSKAVNKYDDEWDEYFKKQNN